MIGSQIKCSWFISPYSCLIDLTIEFYIAIACLSELDPSQHYLDVEFPYPSAPFEFSETPILGGLMHSHVGHYDGVSEIHLEPLLRFAFHSAKDPASNH